MTDPTQEQAEEALDAFIPAREDEWFVSDEVMQELIDRVLLFCIDACDIQLYPYQKQLGRRVIESLLTNDGEEITALFSRQSGKTETIAVVIAGMCILLPALARLEPFCNDPRINKFKDGLWVGIFAHNSRQASIMHDRAEKRIQADSMKEAVRDPQINVEYPPQGSAINDLSNGSFVDCISAAPQTKIEGETYHLIILEECQDILNRKIRKSILPMGAATNATVVKVGTPSEHRNDFYDSCHKNRKRDQRNPHEPNNHFQFDYKVAAKYNPNYAKYVQKQKEKLGEDSDDFRLSYKLHWLTDRGHFISPELLSDCAIEERDHLRKRTGTSYSTFVRPDYPTTHDRTYDYVASIDFGKNRDSTVVTVGKVWWDNPIQVGTHEHYYTHVVNWLELLGDDHEAQYPQILDFLSNYNISIITVDATGKGEPIYDRLLAEALDGDRLGAQEGEIRVIPFVFSKPSKHTGYKLLRQEIYAQRLTFAAGRGAKRMQKVRRFMEQMEDLRKTWRGKYMDVHAPKKEQQSGDREAHDDYPDSLMLLCWGVNRTDTMEAETYHGSIMGDGEIHQDIARGSAYQAKRSRRRQRPRRNKTRSRRRR